MDEKEFIDGLFVKAPRPGAPDFVKGAISIKRADLGNWLRNKQTDDGWINLDIKESKAGKWYCEVNNFKPEKKDAAEGAPFNDKIPNEELEDLPF